MRDELSLPWDKCAHKRTVLAFDRRGKFLHQVVDIVVFCVDCERELDRRQVTRSTSSSGRPKET